MKVRNMKILKLTHGVAEIPVLLGVDVDERRWHTHEQHQQVGHAKVHQEQVGGVLHVRHPEYHDDHQQVTEHPDHEDQHVQQRGGDHDGQRRLRRHFPAADATAVYPRD